MFLVGCQQQTENKLLVAVASNAQYVIDEILIEFAKENQIEYELIVSSSGKLTAQIKEGAPFDVFISANEKYPKSLFRAGLCSEPLIFANGRLVLWSTKEGYQPNIKDLVKKRIERVVMANPKTAPYGEATKEALIHLNIYGQLEEKIVFGESISQVNHFINSASVDLGFTSKSTVLSPKTKGNGLWVEIPDTLYSPIAQGAVKLKNGKMPVELTTGFLKFLSSAKAMDILEKHGYEIVSYE